MKICFLGKESKKLPQRDLESMTCQSVIIAPPYLPIFSFGFSHHWNKMTDNAQLKIRPI